MTRKKQRTRGDRKGSRSRQKGLGKWLYVVVPILAALLIGVGGAGCLPAKGILARRDLRSNWPLFPNFLRR